MASAAIRQAGDLQARLQESLSFLQTQESALGQLEGLCGNAPACGELLDIFQSLRDEKFNGLDLFSHEGHDEPLYVQASESGADVCIHRPLLSVEAPVTALREAVLEAREENRREQAKLREISVASAFSRLDTGAEKIPDTESAKRTILESQKYVLADASAALSCQANSAHDAVLRLFS